MIENQRIKFATEIAKNDINFKYNDKKFTIIQILNIINKAKDGE